MQKQEAKEKNTAGIREYQTTVVDQTVDRHEKDKAPVLTRFGLPP